MWTQDRTSSLASAPEPPRSLGTHAAASFSASSAEEWKLYLLESSVDATDDGTAIRTVVVSAVRAAVASGAVNAARMAQLLR